MLYIGMIDAKIELKMDRNPDLILSEDRFELGKCTSKNKRKTVTIIYEYIYLISGLRILIIYMKKLKYFNQLKIKKPRNL